MKTPNRCRLDGTPHSTLRANASTPSVFQRLTELQLIILSAAATIMALSLVAYVMPREAPAVQSL